MESRITKKFRELKEEKKKALITYITGGDPDLDTTSNLIIQMEKAGSNIIEIGIPYSDPLADGSVIQRASQRAIKGGAKITKIFDTILKVRKNTKIPIAFMIYYNSIFIYGIDKFLNDCIRCGIDGLIIPDLPLEERKELKEMMKNYPIDLIPLVAPTSEGRIKDIVEDASGFIYCISSKGVTGIRKLMESDISEFIGKVKGLTDIPLAIGFGISDEDTAGSLKEIADGIIVGSAVILKIEEGIEYGNIEEKVFDFVSRLSSEVCK